MWAGWGTACPGPLLHGQPLKSTCGGRTCFKGLGTMGDKTPPREDGPLVGGGGNDRQKPAKRG